MIFPSRYKALSQNTFQFEEFQIVPIRYKDRLDIMKWRNEQMYHLRQSELLTKENQESYYQNIVSKLFTLYLSYFNGKFLTSHFTFTYHMSFTLMSVRLWNFKDGGS